MSFSERDDFNTDRELNRRLDTDDDGPAAADPVMVKKFRDQIHALGALWIVLGCAAGVLAGVALSGKLPRGAIAPAERPVFFLMAFLALLWVIVGVAALLKNLWAVYVGLTLSYLSLLGQILTWQFCNILILVFVILQAHRVISWANRMQAAGIPLTTKPS